MKNWIKENLVLVIGLALPVLLIVLFFVAAVIPKAMGTPPQYEMLFTTMKYEYENSPDYLLDFVVKDQHLMVKAKKNDDKGKNFNSKKLMAYHGKTETAREITIDASKFLVGEVVLEETKNFSIDTSPVSPDGFTLEGPNYNSSGLVGDLFGGGNRNSGYRIKKGSIGYKVPNPQPDYYYNQVQFIGWLVKDNTVKK
jgi:hypothetical protein